MSYWIGRPLCLWMVTGLWVTFSAIPLRKNPLGHAASSSTACVEARRGEGHKSEVWVAVGVRTMDPSSSAASNLHILSRIIERFP